MSFETILSQKRIDQNTRDGFWVNRTITDYLDEAAAATGVGRDRLEQLARRTGS